MAVPTTISGGKFLIQVGDGADPEVFSAPCGLTTKGFNQSKETNDFAIPDCSDPDAAVYVERVTASFSSGLSGSGLLASESRATWQAFYDDPEARNVRVKLDGVGWGHWQGAYICNNFNVTGETGGKVTAEIELVSSGQWTWVDAV